MNTTRWRSALMATTLSFMGVCLNAATHAQTLAWVPVQSSSAAALHSSDAKVEALREATLAAQVPGAIVALPVRTGERVKAGQELARIDARMASQGAAANQAQVAAAQAQAAVAGKEYERQQQLFAKRYISQAALDNARAQWQASQAQVKALQAQAGVATTQAALHMLRAPFDAVVASVPVTLGDLALPGKPLVTLYDPVLLRVAAALTLAQAEQVRQASEVQVEIPSAANGRITVAAAQVQVLPTADAQSHTLTVRVQLPATSAAVPGAFARLWWHGAAATDGERFFVPISAVVRRAEMTGVYVRGSEGKPQLRQVRLGESRGDLVEILSGARAGEQVASEPQAAAKVR